MAVSENCFDGPTLPDLFPAWCRGPETGRDAFLIDMTVEHRAAPSLNDIGIELADDGKGTALRLR